MKLYISTSTAARYLICCISLLLSFVSQTRACGPDFVGWQYTMLLEHYTFNHAYFPYQFDPSSRFYAQSWHDESEGTVQLSDKTKYNLAEWRKYLQVPAAVNDTDLKNFIYHNSSSGIKAAFNENNTPLVKAIMGKKNSNDIKQYLLYLNEYKQVMAPPQDVWSYSSYTNSVGLHAIEPFVMQCESLLKNTGDAFLQWRTLYLILRATHFNKHHQQALASFEQNYAKLSKDNSLAQYWCEGIYAGALLRTGQHDKSIYYTARAFANCPDQQMEAMNTYLFSNRQWKKALPYCKNANDSVYVALLEGANHTLPDMEIIQLVYSSNPESPVLKLLWLREAAKIEQFLLHQDQGVAKNIYYLNYDMPIDMDSMYNRTKTLLHFLSLSEKILNHNTALPVKVTVGNTAAYYFYKKGELQKATAILSKISGLPKDQTEQMQYDLLGSLIKLKKDREMDAAKFIALITTFKKMPYGNTNHHTGYYLLHNELAPYFLAQKDTSTAFWTYVHAYDFDADAFSVYAEDYSPESFGYPNFATYLLTQHYSIAQVEELKKSYLLRKGKSSFETYLVTNTRLQDGAKLFDLVIARKHMLAERWDLALNMFGDLPSTYTTVTGANPANFYLNDYIEDDAQGGKTTYTVKQILELAQKLKPLADKDNAASAKDKLLYGTLLYNLSFYGRNHYILDNHWNHSLSKTAYFDHDSIDAHVYLNNTDIYSLPLHESYQDYFHLTNTEKYFKAALPLLTDEEEKAQCTFMLAKCWQKRCPSVMRYNTEYKYMEDLSDYVGHSRSNPWFKVLATNYKNTRTQEQVFNTCSNYRLFLGRK